MESHKPRFTVFDSGFSYVVALDVPGAPLRMRIPTSGLTFEQMDKAKADCQAYADKLNAQEVTQ